MTEDQFKARLLNIDTMAAAHDALNAELFGESDLAVRDELTRQIGALHMAQVVECKRCLIEMAVDLGILPHDKSGE